MANPYSAPSGDSTASGAPVVRRIAWLALALQFGLMFGLSAAGWYVLQSPRGAYAGLAIFVAYVRAMGKAAGAHNEFCGPMAKPHRMFTVTVAALYLGLTPAAWHPRFGAEGAFGLASFALGIIIVGGAFTASRRLARISAALKARK